MSTKLHDWHLRAGARMVDFGGWDMPIQYETGPREEHVRVREAAGLFDIDHMGRLEIEGPGALDFLQRVQTWDVSRLAVGRAHYSMLLNDAGGIIDDIWVYRRAGLRDASSCRELRRAVVRTWKCRGQMWVNKWASSSGGP